MEYIFNISNIVPFGSVSNPYENTLEAFKPQNN